jgi:hypothetical protein
MKASRKLEKEIEPKDFSGSAKLIQVQAADRRFRELKLFSTTLDYGCSCFNHCWMQPRRRVVNGVRQKVAYVTRPRKMSRLAIQTLNLGLGVAQELKDG